MGIAIGAEYRASLLGTIPPFRSSLRDLLETAGGRIRCRRYDRGERVYSEFDEPTEVFALQAGRIRTLRITPQGKDVTLFLVEPGQLFGVDAIAHAAGDAPPWGHDAEALDQDTVVVSVPRQDFGLVAARHPELMSHVVRSLWMQTQDLMDQAETRAFHDVRGRLANAILMLGHKEGVATSRGLVISPAMTHEQLAALAGTRRESVTMALGSWRREGIIASDENERSIVILDVEALAQYREGGTSARVIVDSILARLTAVQRQNRETRIAEVELVRERRRATYQSYSRR